MTNDEIQFWMLIAFAVAFVISFYKIYIMFNTPVEGVDTQTQYNQLEDIIINFLKEVTDDSLSSQTLFEYIIELEVMQDDAYKNFNQNRFNQLLQQLFYIYEVQSIPELILSVQNSK